MNGIIEPPGDKLLRGLTQLDKGEKWLVKPEKLNEEGTLWSPGLRDNVQPGSWFHTHECFYQLPASCTPRPWIKLLSGRIPRASA